MAYRAAVCDDSAVRRQRFGTRRPSITRRNRHKDTVRLGFFAQFLLQKTMRFHKKRLEL